LIFVGQKAGAAIKQYFVSFGERFSSDENEDWLDSSNGEEVFKSINLDRSRNGTATYRSQLKVIATERALFPHTTVDQYAC
jgi:hypothetical protein